MTSLDLNARREEDALASYDFSNVSNPQASKELLRLAEASLAGTVQVAIGCDARATTHTGFFLAGATALGVAAANFASGPAAKLALSWGTLGGSVSLLCAAICCTLAARSVDFHVGGYEPKHLAPFATDERLVALFAAEDVQNRLDFNRSALERQSRWFGRGQWAAMAALPIGAAAYFLSRYLGV